MSQERSKFDGMWQGFDLAAIDALANTADVKIADIDLELETPVFANLEAAIAAYNENLTALQKEQKQSKPNTELVAKCNAILNASKVYFITHPVDVALAFVDAAESSCEKYLQAVLLVYEEYLRIKNVAYSLGCRYQSAWNNPGKTRPDEVLAEIKKLPTFNEANTFTSNLEAINARLLLFADTKIDTKLYPAVVKILAAERHAKHEFVV